MIRVKILLHERGFDDPRPFRTGDRLHEAIVFDDELDSGVEGLLRTVSEQLHIAPLVPAPPKADWAIEYRRRRNRSLALGDVVVVGEQAWGVHDYPRRQPGETRRRIGHIEWKPVSLMGSEVVSDGAAMSASH